jgi:CBS-domain-containing membrane protein
MVKYETITTLELDKNDTILKSHNMPELVHLDDPAFTVMIDFCQTPAFCIKNSANMLDAQHEMEFHGTHLMLVNDENNHVIGLLTTEDLLGEKPIKVIQETRLPREKIMVNRLMTPINMVPAFNIESIEKSRVGNVIHTLHTIESPFALVVRVMDDGEKVLRGCFTTSQISRQLHHNVRKRIPDIDSVTQLKAWKK